jgi:hypothetical protein
MGDPKFFDQRLHTPVGHRSAPATTLLGERTHESQVFPLPVAPVMSQVTTE